MKTVFKKPIFWIIFASISLLCFAYSFKFFPTAFPIVNIDISTDREQAIELAKTYAEQFNWGPTNPSVAVSFDEETQTQTFVELAGGGQQAFREMLKKNYYMPYKWHIRHFQELEKNESHVYLTPQGKLYGFREKISENEVRTSLSHDDALTLVMQSLQQFDINTAPYKLVEDAKNVQLNGRVDRTFVFERSDITLNEGRYRIKAKVRGDKLTQLKQFIKIPQSFTLAYKEMRSANNAIASAASMFSFIFYLLIGCLFGIFILIRQNWIIWTTPIKWALLIAALKFLTTLNSMPLKWMHYQTEFSKYGFLLNIIVGALYISVMTFITTALVFIAAESLTRKAFGKHIRFWNNWQPHIANSYTVLGHTVSGYVMIGFDLAFLISFYFIFANYFNWWVPLSQFVNPNILADYFPWLSSIATSLQAGFVEEAQFRAIPLASAALLGERFGKRNWWIGAALMLQAIVFGAAHANYPALPAYARLVELIIPSLIFAGLYLRFGLLVSVVMHYAYDVFWFALPIFISHAPGIWMNKAAVLFFTFLPLLIVLYHRYKQGTWERLTSDAFNATWRPTGESLFAEKNPVKTAHKTFVRKKSILVALAMLSCLALFFTAHFNTDAPPLKISRSEAITIARTALAQEGISTDQFEAYAKIKANLEKSEDKDLAHRYIRQSYPQAVYAALTGSHLNPPHWVVRLIKFSGSLQERAESYEVLVGARTGSEKPTYAALSWHHKIAENIPGAQRTKKEARLLAEKALVAHGKNLSGMYEISAVPKQLPERIDWTFTFGHKLDGNIKEGEARTTVTLIGDQLAHYYEKIHVPESWKRNELKAYAATNALQTFCNLLIRMLCLLGLCVALLLFSYKKISLHTLIISFAVFMLLHIIKLVENLPQIYAQFNTSEPFTNQLFQTSGTLALQFLIHTIVFASLLSLILQVKQHYAYMHAKTSWFIGLTSGIVASAGWIAITYFKPSVSPLWGYYSALGTAHPLIGFINAHILKYLQYTGIFTFGLMTLNYLTDYGKKILLPALILCCTAGLVFAGFESIDLISYWLISGLLFGAVIFFLWYYLLRYAPESVPLAIAVCFSLSIVQQMLFNVFPNILIIGIICILCIACCAMLLFNRIRKLHA